MHERLYATLHGGTRPAPVYGGDSLSLQVEVLEVRHSKSGAYGVVRWQWCLVNQKSQKVLELVATSLFARTA